MKKVRIIILIMILGSFLFMLSSCNTVAVYEKPGYGPPAHAKAHGVRYKQPKTVVLVDIQD